MTEKPWRQLSIRKCLCRFSVIYVRSIPSRWGPQATMTHNCLVGHLCHSPVIIEDMLQLYNWLLIPVSLSKLCFGLLVSSCNASSLYLWCISRCCTNSCDLYMCTSTYSFVQDYLQSLVGFTTHFPTMVGLYISHLTHSANSLLFLPSFFSFTSHLFCLNGEHWSGL